MENETPIEETRVTRIKNFVGRHKVSITMVATSTAWYAINRAALSQHDEFLKERGLYEEFYTPQDDEL
jgi:hypothetical protein